jgi:hypothetical protein
MPGATIITVSTGTQALPPPPGDLEAAAALLTLGEDQRQHAHGEQHQERRAEAILALGDQQQEHRQEQPELLLQAVPILTLGEDHQQQAAVLVSFREAQQQGHQQEQHGVSTGGVSMQEAHGGGGEDEAQAQAGVSEGTQTLVHQEASVGVGAQVSSPASTAGGSADAVIAAAAAHLPTAARLALQRQVPLGSIAQSPQQHQGDLAQETRQPYRPPVWQQQQPTGSAGPSDPPAAASLSLSARLAASLARYRRRGAEPVPLSEGPSPAAEAGSGTASAGQGRSMHGEYSAGARAIGSQPPMSHSAGLGSSLEGVHAGGSGQASSAAGMDSEPPLFGAQTAPQTIVQHSTMDRLMSPTAVDAVLHAYTAGSQHPHPSSIAQTDMEVGTEASGSAGASQPRAEHQQLDNELS